jgi:nicotinate-nucleotide adenylyltransferase
MRVAIFGGTFDPPHRGHLAVARAAADEFSLDTILFAPAANQPLKPHGTKANFADRLAMVELLCATPHRRSRDARFVPSTLDAPREDGQPNYTIDTLRRLRAELHEQNPADEEELFVITGADSFLDLRRWREPEALLQAAAWIVVSRPSFSLAGLERLALTPQQRARVRLLEGVHEPTSASEVRDRLEAGLDASSLLTPEVLAYIQEHRLYHSAKTS